MLSKPLKSRKNNLNLPLEVLVLPSRSSLQVISSPNPNNFLYKVVGKQGLVSSQKISVQKRDLFSQLEIYEWRLSTDFPIPKTKYVSIQPSLPASSSAPLIIFNENCPLTLTDLSPIPFLHILYVLKESIYGFERLCRKFGSFQISDKMISFNEKGLCRVWINQNFALNSIEAFTQEVLMIQLIKQIMKTHCQKCQQSQQLFSKLSLCTSFVGCLKQIDLFVNSKKLIVPHRIPIGSSLQPSRLNTFNPFDPIVKQISSLSHQNFRHSIIPSPHKENEKYTQDKQFDIKRFKSEEKIRIVNMKASDGQTSYSRNNKETKCSGTALFSSLRETSYDKFVLQNPNKKERQSLEDSCFVMDNDMDSCGKQKKQKKELSHSEAAIKGKQKSHNLSLTNRKLSSDSAFYRFNSPFPIRSQHEAFTTQVNLVLDDDEKYETMNASKSKIDEEQQEDSKIREEHTGTIMKINGWNNIVGLLKGKNDLNQSFHEEKDEVIVPKEAIKLAKLDSIHRRQVAMSILPEQYEDII